MFQVFPNSGTQLLDAMHPESSFELVAVMVLVVELTQSRALADNLLASVESPNMKNHVTVAVNKMRSFAVFCG